MQTQRRTAARTIEPEDFLLPEPSQRRRTPARTIRPAMVEDAVFEVMPPEPRQYRRTNDNPAPPRTKAKPRLLPLSAHLGAKLAAAIEKRLALLSPQAFVALLSSLVFLVFWMCGGFSALNAEAQDKTAALFALVDTAVDTQDANGMKLALVTGGVRNTSGKIITAPRLAVVAGSRQDVIGTVVLTVDRIGPGVTIPFAGRFKLAGGKSTDIAIIPEHP